MSGVIDEPVRLSVAPSLPTSCSVVRKCARRVEAPTVFTHGPPWSVVPAPGPLLPAEAFARPPAL